MVMINIIQSSFVVLILCAVVLMLYSFSYELPFIGPILIKRYYNSGAYEQQVHHICEKAMSYFSRVKVQSHSLVIFDVDDTALYNLRFRAGTDLLKPKTVAIQPVLALYKFLVNKGFKVVFLTSRDFCEETKNELINAGYTKFEELICMNHFDDDLTAVWKASKRKELSKVYTIVGSVADRDRDFFDNYNGYKVKLPNYLYN